MEELQDPFLVERTQKGGARSTRGFGARPASSVAAIMADYTEIFGGFSAFCSIPVLVLPEAMEGYGKALLESQSMNYSEIFGDLDAGTFPLLYEELLSTEKGSKEGDYRFQEGPNGIQFEKGVFEQLDVPIRDHIKISNVNQKSSTFYSSLNTEQLNISGRSGQKSIIDEVKSTICSFGFQANCGPDFEADTASSTGLVEDDQNPKTIETDDHILCGYMEEEKGGKEEEFLNTCFVGIDGSENDLNDDHKPYKYSPIESKDTDLNQHSRSSSYHSTSSGDLFSDYSFLTVSDISLQTQPLQVPPPSRAPPKLDMKQEMPKSEVFEASDTTFSAELISETYKGYQGHHVGVLRTRHALKETAKSNYPIYLNVEVDASSAAAASAAAIVEAMEQAQSSLKSAKELMERNRESPQSGRRINSHYFGSWNEQNISFAGRLRHRTPKLVQKVVPNQVEMANPNFSEHAEGEAQGKESEFSLLSDERERFHEWKIDKQFYELVGSDKLMRTRVISDEKYTRDEAAPIARQFFPEKETYGTHKKINSHSDNENKMEKLHKYRSEKKLYSGGELQVQDSNAKNLKFGDTVENEEMFDILETSDLKSVRDDEEKQKVGTVIQLRDESKFKAEDGIRLIKHDRNEKELKECQESSIREAGEKNEDDNKDLNSHGRNDSGIMDFYSDSKLEGFGNEAVGKKLGGGKEFDEIPETSIVSEVFNYNSTSEIKKFMVKLSSLENVNEAVVEKECRKSFSTDKENLEEMRDDCQLGKLNKTIKETYIIGYKEGKYSDLKGIDSTSVKEVNGNISETNISNEPEKNEKLKHEQRDKLNTLNRSEAKVGKVSVWPDFLADAKDEFNLKQNEEKKKEYELMPKFENFVDKLTADEEQRKGDKNLIGRVQAAVELEKKIQRLCTDQQGLQRIRVQDDEAIQQSKSLSASVNASGSLLKQMEKSIPNEWRDANYIRNDLSDSERKEAEQKRILEEERDREREKDRIAVEKTSESCEKAFPESRERHEKFAEVSERSETIANKVKLRVERAAVERATVEARERAIERSLAEQASLAARRQAETLTNVSKEKSRKHNTSECLVWPGEKDSEIILKPASNVHDAPVDANSQMAGLEEESPLRCKARKERHQRMVERAAKALAEKNMRDLLAQKEQVERNRLAESLDAEVKRWSNGKEGNLRALLSTLQYILGHDSGWQPIPLTEVITAAAVRKAYRKATLYVHPDKLQQRGAIIQHKYICEKVFDLLKDAWNRFNSEGW